LYKQLCERSANTQNWIVLNCALGEKEETREFNVMESDDFSSFLEPDHDQKLFLEANKIAHRIPVQVRQLDSIINDISDRPPGGIYLKLDIQGFDIEVMKGLVDNNARISAPQTEVSLVPIYKRMPNWRTSVDELCARGFQLSGFWPVTLGERLEAIEFDCVMVRGTTIET